MMNVNLNSVEEEQYQKVFNMMTKTVLNKAKYLLKTRIVLIVIFPISLKVFH